jgi:hypothetical protein
MRGPKQPSKRALETPAGREPQPARNASRAAAPAGDVARVGRLAAMERALLALHLGPSPSEERRGVVVGPRARRTVEVAAEVARALARDGIDAAAIGAVALAVHGFVRPTRGLDLGVRVPESVTVEALAAAVRRPGVSAEATPPASGDDRGVVSIRGDGFDLVQVVRFADPPHGRESLAGEALEIAVVLDTFPFRVVDLPHLVALKLATAAERDELDVVDLLAARPDADLRAIRELCERHGVGAGLERAVVCAGR